MDLEAYKLAYKAGESSPGWEAIDRQLERLYGAQEPKHWANAHPYVLGGPDPLEGISIYRSSAQEDHLHVVTFGMSELHYSEESVDEDFSRFGCEFTFRLALIDVGDDEPFWVADMLQNLARYVYTSKKWFEEFHYIPANGPIRQGANTKVSALATAIDPELGAMQTPHGRVEFIQFLGITQDEYEKLKGGELACSKLFEAESRENPLFITRLSRGGS